MLARLESALGRLGRALLVLAAFAVLGMTALVVLASIMRYLLGAPFRFTEELVALLYAAMMFLTIPLCTLRNDHIGMMLVVERSGQAGRRVLRLLACLVTITFCVWFTIEAWKFAAFGRELGSRSEQVDILLWPWMALMPATMALVALIVLLQTIRAFVALRTGTDGEPRTEPEKDPF